MRKRPILALLIVLISGCDLRPPNESLTNEDTTTIHAEVTLHTPVWVSIKYRSDAVDIAGPQFESLDASGSSVLRGVWYDSDNEYKVITLDTYSHVIPSLQEDAAAKVAGLIFGR